MPSALVPGVWRMSSGCKAKAAKPRRAVTYSPAAQPEPVVDQCEQIGRDLGVGALGHGKRSPIVWEDNGLVFTTRTGRPPSHAIVEALAPKTSNADPTPARSGSCAARARARAICIDPDAMVTVLSLRPARPHVI